MIRQTVLGEGEKRRTDVIGNSMCTVLPTGSHMTQQVLKPLGALTCGAIPSDKLFQAMSYSKR